MAIHDSTYMYLQGKQSTSPVLSWTEKTRIQRYLHASLQSGADGLTTASGGLAQKTPQKPKPSDHTRSSKSKHQKNKKRNPTAERGRENQKSGKPLKKTPLLRFILQGGKDITMWDKYSSISEEIFASISREVHLNPPSFTLPQYP